MKTTEMIECAKGKTLKHTRRFVGNSRRESYLCDRPDEVDTSVIRDDDPKILDDGNWSIAVGHSTFCYDTDPETNFMEFSQIKAEAGSGNKFWDTLEIIPSVKAGTSAI